MIRKSLGFVATIAVAIVAGYQLAWNKNQILDLVANLGGIWGLLAGVAGIAGIVLVVFWPSRWDERTRQGVTLAVIFVLLFGGGEFIRGAFEEAPWATLGAALGVILGTVLVTALLWAVTTLDSMPGFIQRLYLRLRPNNEQ